MQYSVDCTTVKVFLLLHFLIQFIFEEIYIPRGISDILKCVISSDKSFSKFILLRKTRFISMINIYLGDRL